MRTSGDVRARCTYVPPDFVITTGVALAILLSAACTEKSTAPAPKTTEDSGNHMSNNRTLEMRIPEDVMAAWEASGEAPVLILVSADASKCSVRGNEISCSDLASHLEQSLKVPRTTPIGVTARPGQTGTAHSRIADLLKSYGYSQAVALDVRFATGSGGPIEESR